MTREECVDAAGGDDELLFADGFDEASSAWPSASTTCSSSTTSRRSSTSWSNARHDLRGGDGILRLQHRWFLRGSVHPRLRGCVTVTIDLDDIEETRAYFDHEVPQPYRQAFSDMLAELKKQRRSPTGANPVAATRRPMGFPSSSTTASLLCVTCAGLFYMLARDVLREDDVRAVELARDEKERLGFVTTHPGS